MIPSDGSGRRFGQSRQSDTVLSKRLKLLPAALQREYERFLQQPFLTRADLWALTRDHAELTQIHAFLNEQSHAQLVGAGLQAITRADTPISRIDDELQREVLFARRRDLLGDQRVDEIRPIARVDVGTPENLRRRFDDALSSGSSVELSAPALTLLSHLTTSQVLELKADARRTILSVARDNAHAESIEAFMVAYVPACIEYLGRMTERIASWYPEEFRQHRSQRAGLLWGATATVRAIASANFWTSLRSHAGALVRETLTGSAIGGLMEAASAAIQSVGGPDPLSGWVPVAGSVVGGAAAATTRLVQIARAVADADVVLLWEHPGIPEIRSAVPGHWLNRAYAGNRWLV
jgi:hypothetical protein